MIHPVKNTPAHKRSFIPSLWEKQKVGNTLVHYWCRLVHYWCRLVRYWCRLVHYWCRLVHYWCRLVQYWCKLVHYWCRLVPWTDDSIINLQNVYMLRNT